MSARPTSIVTPVLKTTLYDRASSWSMVLFAAVGIVCLGVVSKWLSDRLPPPPEGVTMELVELPGGFEDGTPGETLRVDSPLPEVRDAAPVEEVSDRVEIAEALSTVADAAESGVGLAVASDQSQPQFDTGIENKGRPGSAKGTGRKGLGVGGGTGGFPREQRWFVRFGDKAGIDEYAKQLGFFGVELGALLPDSRLAYLSKLNQPVPDVRYVKTGKDEQRLYMTWQGGDRRGADVELFKRANIDVGPDTVIFHFYSKATESKLAQLERDYKGRPVGVIRRTYFVVEVVAGGYQFAVTRQTYFQ
ncbi:MAG: hypothetical protein DWH84_03795 [Planctomycetota bacterium]|nr:hypothetical protein [Planctomycetales bacterium]RLS44967.1 MAG: hypothetical protein DWH84_03795 [Planctomycetota bacterium]